MMMNDLKNQTKKETNQMLKKEKKSENEKEKKNRMKKKNLLIQNAMPLLEGNEEEL